jgi:hypothetical protein
MTEPARALEGSSAGADGPGLRRQLALAALLALVYSVAAAAVDPTVLDEAVDAGQVVSGAVVYPPGHPHEVFYRSVYSLSNQLAGWTYALAPEALAQCAARNVVVLFVSMLVPCWLATALCRSALAGAFAGALWASESHLLFDGVYPLHVFPQFFTHGQLGLGFSVLVVAAWLAGMPRLAGALTGVAPMVHAGLAPLVYAWVLMFLGFSRSRPRGAELRRAGIAFAAGAAASAALAAWLAWGVERPAPAGPYAADAAAAEAWSSAAANFVRWTDPHRVVPDWLSLDYGVATLAFALLSAAVLAGGERAGARASSSARWTVAFGALALAASFGLTALQRLGRLPEPLLVLMPARYSNLTVMLLPALAAAAAWSALDRVGERARRAATLVLAALVALAAVRWILYPDGVRLHLAFAAWGAVLGLAAWSQRARPRWSLSLAAGTLALAAATARAGTAQQAGALALGAIAACFACAAVERIGAPLPGGRTSRAALALACLALLAVVVPGRTHGRDRRWRIDVISPADLELVRRLDQLAPRSEPILTPAWKRAVLQLKTGRPVVFELETLWMLTYRRGLAPAIGAMVRDLYGVDYSRPQALRELAGGERLTVHHPAWPEVWRARPRAEWQRLAARYSFRLVVAPAGLTLDLPLEFAGEAWTVYSVPSP